LCGINESNLALLNGIFSYQAITEIGMMVGKEDSRMTIWIDCTENGAEFYEIWAIANSKILPIQAAVCGYGKLAGLDAGVSAADYPGAGDLGGMQGQRSGEKRLTLSAVLRNNIFRFWAMCKNFEHRLEEQSAPTGESQTSVGAIRVQESRGTRK
jgi:hypothetical protein